LGLTEFLKGNESITKKELLKFIEEKNIAPNITVRSIPRDEMDKMYEGYSLGGYTHDTQEHIVFQIGKDDAKVGQLFKSEHYNTEYGTGNFAWARVQVGYDKLDQNIYDPSLDKEYRDFYDNIAETLNNTLIIDEIQSDWLQKGQDEGFISDYDIIKNENLEKYFKENNMEYFIEYEPDIQMNILRFPVTGEAGRAPHNVTRGLPFKHLPLKGKDLYPRYEIFKDGVHQESILPDVYEYSGKQTLSSDEAVRKYLLKSGDYGVPDFPIKESKKWVELVLNKMIEKAILDGRDSIAITNGEIQYNRYEAQPEKEKKGLKKFYDTIVYDQLEKISDKYNVELERIDISEGEAPKELQDSHFGNQIKRAQDDGFVLKKVNLQFLWDRTKDTDIPGHAALYSDAGVGQGRDYIENYLNELAAPYRSQEERSQTGLASIDVYPEAWNKIRNNEVYIWIKEQDISRDRIGWSLPIVPVQDAINYAKDSLLPEIKGEDLGAYQKYVQDAKPPKGEEIGPEQLIKMKLPKKLQKERLSKPIKLTKVKQQTERLFA
jgi:hypothetical protein